MRHVPLWRLAVAVLTLSSLFDSWSLAQQPAIQSPRQQAAAQQSSAQTVPAVAPQGFTLNALQQAQLDQVLEAWQNKSTQIKTFSCSFERYEYDIAFGPDPAKYAVDGQDIPLNKNKGELSYQRPDKGSFQIIEINTFQAQTTPGQQAPTAAWIKKADAIGEHWVCDGQSVFEYRHDQKQLVERPIPPNMRGQAIVDGPLPFLFGAEAAKLKERYWMRIAASRDPNEIMLQALPRYQQQAADFSQVDVILDRNMLLPKAMQVHMPDRNRHVYIFDLASASVNSPLQRLQSFFQRPRVPFNYKHVVESVPVAQTPPENEKR